jgi:hypothetical protein
MAILTEVCNSFKLDMLLGRHDFTVAADSFKLALYLVTANMGKATTAYTATDEASVSGGGGGYTAGGLALTNVTPVLDTDTAICDFSPDAEWTLTGGTDPALNAGGCLLYNDTITTPTADPAVATYVFASDTTATGIGATFTVVFPAAAAATAVLRLA